MIKIYPNLITVSNDDINYEIIRREFVKRYKERNPKPLKLSHKQLFEFRLLEDTQQKAYLKKLQDNDKFKDGVWRAYYLYGINSRTKELNIPRGLLHYLKPLIQNSEIEIYEKLNSKIYNTKQIVSNIQNYKNIIDGIELRDYQLEAIRFGLIRKRCILQLSTGSGKSYIMCGIIKLLKELNDNKFPTTIVLEPTSRLKLEMINTFKSAGIDTVDYSENRKIIENCVNIAHPSSLNNDLEKDSKILENVEVLFGDEGHHFKSNQYSSPILNCPNLIYSIAMSASAITQRHINQLDIRKYDIEEIQTIGITGPLAYNITADNMIDKGTLAKPCLIVMENQADEEIPDPLINANNWHILSKYKLQSERRTNKIVQVTEFFNNKGRKSLVLVNTKDWAERIVIKLFEQGINEECRISFGNNVFLKYNGEKFEKDKDDVFQKYKNGEIKILVGTQHLIEGIDVPSLDVIVLPSCGKSERIQIQSCGRALRTSKTGNMAYIIDFNDFRDPILNYQFKARLRRYKDIIGIQEEDIHYAMSNEKLEEIFNKYEK